MSRLRGVSGRARGQAFTAQQPAAVIIPGMEIPLPSIFMVLSGLTLLCAVAGAVVKFKLDAR